MKYARCQQSQEMFSDSTSLLLCNILRAESTAGLINERRVVSEVNNFQPKRSKIRNEALVVSYFQNTL